MARLKDTYYKSIVPAMMKEFKYKSVMQVPRLEKVVLNVAWRGHSEYKGC